MTHQNHQTNGASLEDCHTNFFALTDLCGIKWRKFFGNERPNTSLDPLEDPILRSYSRCLDMNILCVWRRVESPRQEPDPNSTGGIFDSITNTTTVHPPLSLTAAKELWIFWYGEEPELSGAVDSQLLKQGDSGMNSGAWESGLSYECRSLLFKALHIIIERSLLAKGFVRLGKWFVQPCTGSDQILGKSSQRLSISFVFFVHGDTVCASIDLREHSAVKLLTQEYLEEAAAATSQYQQQQQQSSHLNTTSPLLSASLQHGSASAAAASIASSDVQQKQVILAPYGMSAILTGNSIKNGDAAADKLLEEWGLFYPMCNTENSDIPPVVEVISGGYKMSYPSKFVLVTELDESSTNSSNMSNNSDVNNSDTTSPNMKSGICAPNAASNSSLSSPNNIKSRVSPKKTFKDLKTLSKYENSNYNNFNNHNNINTHAPLSVAIELPERVWQDCISHPIKSAAAAATLAASNAAEQSSPAPSTAPNNTGTTTIKQEPMDGMMNPEDIKTEPGLSENNSSQNNPDSTTNSANSENMASANNNNNLSNNNNNNNQTDSKQLWDFVDPTKKTTCICARSTNSLNSGTPHGGASSYSRNSMGGDLMTVPSVGSPGSAAASPHPNSQLSQPSSVPPVDQLMSPRPPPSVPTNLQQPNTPLEHLLDKNTPAPTPTDQHDNKSITASPYIHQNPSIEAPLSQEPAMQQQQQAQTPQAQISSTANSNNPTVTEPALPANIKVEPGLDSEDQPQVDQQPQSQQQQQQNTETQNPQQSTAQPQQQMNPLAVITSSNNIMSSTEIGKSLLEQFKPPRLIRKEFGCEEEEDNTEGLLYDYTMTEAWMAHPVKRFKPNDLRKPQRRGQMKNLYDSHTHHKPVLPSPNSFYKTAHDNQVKRDIENNAYASANSNILGNQNSSTSDYTCEINLKTSMQDLYTMDLLDNSHNSPAPTDDIGSNNVGSGLLLGHKTPPEVASGRTNGLTDMLPSDPKKLYNNNTNTIRPEDLQKMFPTPPSHEPHPNSSPCGNNMDMQMTEMTEIHQLKLKQEPLTEVNYNLINNTVIESKNMSSTVSFDILEECTYVYQPETACTFLTSDKYSPTMLPSASLPVLPSPPKYKPVWQRSKRTKVLQQITTPPVNSTNNPQQLQQQAQQQQQHLQQHQNHMRQQRENRPPSSSTLLLSQLNGPPARVNLPTISPAMGSPMMHRRTPIHPPPPYEQAISSPATSTSSYLNRQYHSMEQPETPVNPPSFNIRLPETNALLVNVLLFDTSLDIFRDHNFDSCTLCVCNADNTKCVGNIRGSDSGLYVALPGTSFNPAHNSNNNMRTISAYGGENNQINHLSGYNDEDPIRCLCGFSAVVNRRLSHRSGLFYEDEMEITGIAEDPAKYKQKSITALFDNGGMTEEQKAQLAQVLMDLLRDECTTMQTSSSSIHRALSRYQSAANRRKSAKALLSNKKAINRVLNILEFTDANDIICLAIENGKIYFNQQQNQMGHQNNMSLITKSTISVHKWPFVQADGTKNNQDIVRVMKSLQTILQNAFQMKSRQNQKDAAYAVTGPLTWRQFHRLAHLASGLCEPQPIPALIVGHEKDWLSVAPYAIHYWDKLLLEPYSYSKDIAFMVVCPDNEDVLANSKMYFKELSTTYEMCRLGRHTPMTKWNGFLPVNSGCILPNQQRTSLDDWFDSLPDRRFGEQLKMYAHALMSKLAPYLSKIVNDKTILYPGDLASGNPTIIKGTGGNTGVNIGAPTSPQSHESSMTAEIKPPISPIKQEPGTESNGSTVTNEPATSNAAATILHDPMSEDDDINPPIIVVYLVEPFTYGNDSPDVQRVACLALLRSFSEMLNALPESIRGIVNIQIVSLESVMELGRNRRRERFSDEMKCLALNIFSKCRRNLVHSNNVKSLTGFGTAANIEHFLKSKDDKNRLPYKMFTPAYILAPIHEKSDKTDLFRIQQQYPVMYCSYCVSEDQSWLLATATDDRGELLEKIVINIEIPNRTRRKKTPARRHALQKLMEFIMGIISQTVHPWRLVIGRIGRIGHGEMKSWSWLLSKQNLQKMSKQLKEMCKQCSIMFPQQVPSILSVCLVTLEPDSKLRVMPDQFTPDERFSRISMQNPLSTPQDVSCTHILVFPISAVCQSSQKAFNELNEPNDNDFLCDFDDDNDDINDMDNFDIFDININHESNINENDQMEFPRNFQNDCGNNFNTNMNRMDQQEEEVGQLLQQPLAVGYFVSTAPTGRMPSWFWSSCPHLEDVCPVFLKTALHLHLSGIQQNTDDPLVQNQSSVSDHPLDSQLTTDVLRYVLEGYNVLSWLALDSNTHDRLSCLPIHVQVLMQLYHMTAAMA